mgnify:CR=1 FL=1
MTEFEKRMSTVCRKLWADIHLLCIIWSYKDTQDDDSIIQMLDDWIEDKHLNYEVIAGSMT